MIPKLLSEFLEEIEVRQHDEEIEAWQEEIAVVKTIMNALVVCLESPESEVESLREAIRGVDVGAIQMAVRGVRRTAGTLEEDATVE